jgi:3-hydroxyacyl-[acyl-carrier-protein] dehydratase
LFKISGQYCIKADHPSLNGHFPGNPIVPAVVILDYARSLLAQHCADMHIVGLRQAKFFRPLRPDQDFTIDLIQHTPTHIRFECSRVFETLAAGIFIVETSHV